MIVTWSVTHQGRGGVAWHPRRPFFDNDCYMSVGNLRAHRADLESEPSQSREGSNNVQVDEVAEDRDHKESQRKHLEGEPESIKEGEVEVVMEGKEGKVQVVLLYKQRSKAQHCH